MNEPQSIDPFWLSSLGLPKTPKVDAAILTKRAFRITGDRHF